MKLRRFLFLILCLIATPVFAGFGVDLFDANKGTFTEAGLLGAEAITAQNDRDFNTDIGNWTVENYGGSGTLAWNEDPIGGVDDKQALLTSDGDSVFRASLNTSEWTCSPNTLHKVSAKMYVPAGNTLKSVGFITADIEGESPSSYVKTLLGNTWTEVSYFVFFAADVVGSITIMFNGNPADGDKLYYDDISVKPIDISWVPYPGSANTIEIDSNALLITYVDSSGGAYMYLNDAADLNSDLIVGAHYVLTFNAKVGAGDNVTIYEALTGSSTPTITATSFISYEICFTASSTDGHYLRGGNMGAGEEIWLDTLVLKEITPAPFYIYQELLINHH